MLEDIGNVFTYKRPGAKHIGRVITTNGSTNSEGKAVMGRGVALQAASQFKTLPSLLGALIGEFGNHVHVISTEGLTFVTFPVKYNWWEAADLNLIHRSARELVSVTNREEFDLTVLPRPGTGNGKLSWNQVRPILQEVFNDDKRFVVLTPNGFYGRTRHK